MSESWQTGTPAQVGWYECDEKTGNRTIKIVCYWKSDGWRESPESSSPFFNQERIIRWRGPLVVLEPSVGARERAERLAAWAHNNGLCKGRAEMSQYFYVEITAAEQAAFARGKEEGRREEESRWRVELCEDANFLQWVHDRLLEFGEEYTKGEMKKFRGIIEKLERADPPAQPAEEEYKKVLADSERASAELAKARQVNLETLNVPCTPPAQPAATSEHCPKCGKLNDWYHFREGQEFLHCSSCDHSWPVQPAATEPEKCSCVKPWDGKWDSLALDEIGLYGGSEKAWKNCKTCQGSGKKLPVATEPQIGRYPVHIHDNIIPSRLELAEYRIEELTARVKALEESR